MTLSLSGTFKAQILCLEQLYLAQNLKEGAKAISIPHCLGSWSQFDFLWKLEQL